MSRNCIVCGSTNLVPDSDYLRCNVCGHEILLGNIEQTYIINEQIDGSDVGKLTPLDRFKQNTLKRSVKDRFKLLVDFGSATGRFLSQNKGLFSRVIGIEITPDVLEYSKETLGIEVLESLDDLKEAADVITSWHSLEHVPENLIHGVLKEMRSKIVTGGSLLISVPNSRSFQYELFKKRYAYYDVPNHHHQFTMESLDRLLQSESFKRKRLFYSAVYNIFGWLQGMLNYSNSTHNYLYYRLKRNNIERKSFTELIQYLLLPFCLPFAALGALIEYSFPEKQGVLTVLYEKTGEIT